MFTASADLYDAIYSPMKNYPVEAAAIAALLEELRPGTRRVLDVACGTGEHMALLRKEHGLEVDGFDLDASMLGIARGKSPDATFTQGNMIDFELGRRYEAVMCLFSSIGYVRTTENLVSTLDAFRRHTTADGIVIVEPWFTPEVFNPGRPFMAVVDADDRKICRMARTRRDGRTSFVYFDYLVNDGSEVEYRSEVHELGLFTTEETLEAFAAAGMVAEYRPESAWSKRGLYIGRAV